MSTDKTDPPPTGPTRGDADEAPATVDAAAPKEPPDSSWVTWESQTAEQEQENEGSA